MRNWTASRRALPDLCILLDERLALTEFLGELYPGSSWPTPPGLLQEVHEYLVLVGVDRLVHRAACGGAGRMVKSETD